MATRKMASLDIARAQATLSVLQTLIAEKFHEDYRRNIDDLLKTTVDALNDAEERLIIIRDNLSSIIDLI